MDRTLCGFVAAAVLVSANAFAQNIYVDKDATGGLNNGSSWNDAFTRLQDGLDEAVSTGDPVLVAEGTYRFDDGDPLTLPTETDSFTIDPAGVKVNVEVYGGFLGNGAAPDPPSIDPEDPDGSFDKTVLRGDGGGARRYHVVTILDVNIDADVLLRGFRIKGGWARGDADAEEVGAGVQVLRSSASEGDYGQVILENIWFDSNWANEKGGGVYYGDGAVGDLPHQIENCRFTNNSARRGGGVYLSTDTGLNHGNCTLARNGVGDSSSRDRAAKPVCPTVSRWRRNAAARSRFSLLS